MEYQNADGKAVFYLGLCELIEMRLSASADYNYAVEALNGCWNWVEGKNVPAKVLLDLFHDDDDYGVEASMGVEQEKSLWDTWACIAVGVVLTSVAAYKREGVSYLPANLEAADSPQTHDQFRGCFFSLIPVPSLIEHYQMLLDALPFNQVTRSRVRDCAFLALHQATVA